MKAADVKAQINERIIKALIRGKNPLAETVDRKRPAKSFQQQVIHRA